MLERGCVDPAEETDKVPFAINASGADLTTVSASFTETALRDWKKHGRSSER
jgi:hypothetical protein